MRAADEALRVMRPSRLPGGGASVLGALAAGRSAVVAAPAGSGKRDLGSVAALDAVVSRASWALGLAPDAARANRWAARARAAMEGTPWREAVKVLSPAGGRPLGERVAAAAGGRGWIVVHPQGLQDLLAHSEPFRRQVLPGLGLAAAEGITDQNPASLLHLRHLLRLVALPARLGEERLPFLLLLDNAAAAAPAGEQLLPPSALPDAERLVVPGQTPRHAVGWVVHPGTGPDRDDIQVLEGTSAAPSEALRGVLETVREATTKGRWVALVDSAFMDPATARLLEQGAKGCHIHAAARPADLLAARKGRDWRGTVSGAILASDVLHPAAVARNLSRFLDPTDATLLFVRPAGSAIDPSFFLSGDPAARHALDRGLAFASGAPLSAPLATSLGLLAVLVAWDAAGGEERTIADTDLSEALGMPTEQAGDILSQLAEGGWVRPVRLANLASAAPTGRLEVVGGANLEREVGRHLVPVGCTAADRARLRCEGERLGEMDIFRAAAFLHQGKEVRAGRSVYRVTGDLAGPGAAYDLELARAHEARLDLVGGDLGQNVVPILGVSGLAGLEPADAVRIHPDGASGGRHEPDGEALLLLPLMDGAGLGLALDAPWLSALVAYAGEVLFAGGAEGLRDLIGANDHGQVALAQWDGEIEVEIRGHRFRQARSAERGERRLAKPLTFRRHGPFTALMSMLPAAGRDALFRAARVILPLQRAGLGDVALFHRATLSSGPPDWRLVG